MPAPISIPAPDHPVIRPCPSFPSLRRSYLHAGGGAERGADSAATPVAARGAGGPGGAHVGPENSHLVYVMDLWYVCGSLSAVAAASLHFSLAPSSVASGRFLSLSLSFSVCFSFLLRCSSSTGSVSSTVWTGFHQTLTHQRARVSRARTNPHTTWG